MGKIIAFPLMRPGDGGTIHVWARPEGDFEIGHESSSGNSWGSFELFNTAQAAVAGAHRLNGVQYEGRADVYLSTGVLAALHPPSPSPAYERGDC